jgi:hypothetical protein
MLPGPLAVPCRREARQPMSSTLLQIWTPPFAPARYAVFVAIPVASRPEQSPATVVSTLCQPGPGRDAAQAVCALGALKGENPPARPSDPRFLFPLPSPHSAHPSSYPLFSATASHSFKTTRFRYHLDRSSICRLCQFFKPHLHQNHTTT